MEYGNQLLDILVVMPKYQILLPISPLATGYDLIGFLMPWLTTVCIWAVTRAVHIHLVGTGLGRNRNAKQTTTKIDSSDSQEAVEGGGGRGLWWMLPGGGGLNIPSIIFDKRQ